MMAVEVVAYLPAQVNCATMKVDVAAALDYHHVSLKDASVPEGTFWMGCNETVDDACDSNESPYHEVYLDTFSWMFMVTAGEFRACVDAGDCYYDNPVDSHYSTYMNRRDDRL